MHGNSVWLGRARQPIKLLMFGFIAVSLLLYAWLVVSRFIDPNAYGMYEMIRPSGKPLVQLSLFCFSGAVILAAIYLSDFNGEIEPQHTGFFDILSLVLSRIAMMMIAFIVLVMFYEVVSRYVFLAPTLWANELSLWGAAFVFLLSGQYAMQQRCHIRIPVIYDRMPFWMRKVSDTLSVLLICAFVLALVWGGYNDAATRFARMETFGTAWDPPIPGIIKPFLLLAMVLVALQSVSNLIADWNKENAYEDPEGVDETEIENIKRTLEER
ncbi:TRAP transporter small permease [Palleronia sp. LCG004]|uniref:TRAP transporter small permease subunit n=1 Tax=Palleronia sp. LCG004 TaxID=3079304 RepID=UPI0029426427|nr:TRAP transporter small permease [Palleronia sp. LCG004]WOI55384.1 TRAP transporter small permease [Palleronia sp. LCG004]